MANLANIMNKYYVVVSSSIGIPCNLISIFIFARLMRNKTNMGFLCMCQSIIDLCVMMIILLVLRSYPLLFPVNFGIINDHLCRLLTFLKRYDVQVSSWMCVLITFDRFIFVLYEQDQRFRFMKKKINLALIIMGIFICLAILDIPNLFFGLVINAKTGVTLCTAPFAILFTTDIMTSFIRTYIPMILMLLFSVIMIRKILNKKRLTNNQSSQKRKEYQFTIAVMAYNVYFFVFNFPYALFYIFNDVNLYNGALIGDFGATYSFLNFVFLNLTLSQPALSFFINFAFNKLFRQEIFMLFGKLFGNGTKNRIQPSNTFSRA